MSLFEKGLCEYAYYEPNVKFYPKLLCHKFDEDKSEQTYRHLCLEQYRCDIENCWKNKDESKNCYLKNNEKKLQQHDNSNPWIDVSESMPATYPCDSGMKSDSVEVMLDTGKITDDYLLNGRWVWHCKSEGTGYPIKWRYIDEKRI